ncbi:MAG: UDP-glucose/GDP-mannose dehydrogenase family protein [Halobacteriovoraceae bacterium]|nr:UDP-glucose/GDP-mannose dehydrogenase family protein [Halobacteriovoraceae bacterium]
MRVSVIGTGYVGLVSGTCFAEIGHRVTCIDIDQVKIEKLRSGKSPIYEPGLNDLLERNIKSERLDFSAGNDSINESDVIFLAVGTPSNNDGTANLKYLYEATENIAPHLKEDAVVVIKSTVPVHTSTKLKTFLDGLVSVRYHLVNNPEFLKEGSAIDDFMRPDRVIIGSNDPFAEKAMDELYAPLVMQGNPIFHMSNLSAEVSKYAANCYLATKISFINEMAKLCDLVGADIEEVRKGISSDKRIGGHFLYPGPGYGGSCFPKDVKALVATAKESDLDLKVVNASEEVNKVQKTYMFEKMKKHFNGNLKGKTFAFWGVAFKANTDDIRETAAIDMARALVSEGAHVNFYDPVADRNFEAYVESSEQLSGNCTSFSKMYDCIRDTDGLVTITEWREFKNPDFKMIKNLLKEKVVFDARNLFPTDKVLAEGLDYYAIGKLIKK